MDYVYLIQEREFIRLNEATYKVGKTSAVMERWLASCPRDSRVFIFANVSDCHKVWADICKVFDYLFERRAEYGECYYSGKLDDMKKEFMICIINDLYGADTEIVDIEEHIESVNPMSDSAQTSEDRSLKRSVDNATMLRKIGAKSVIRLKVPEENT